MPPFSRVCSTVGVLFLCCGLVQETLARNPSTLLKLPFESTAVVEPGAAVQAAEMPRRQLIPADRHQTILKENELNAALTFRGSGNEIFRINAPGVVYVFTSDGHGSGGVVDSSGLIVTNWHVVGDATEVGIVFKPVLGTVRRNRTYIGDVVKLDKSVDLALVQIRTPPTEFTVLDLGRMQDVEVGMDAHAIGHPMDTSWTYTKGVVSAVRKGFEWSYSEDRTLRATVIQTQTPINPGSSGGPLFHNDGSLIGINSFSTSESEGLNFAVSVDDVRKFLGDGSESGEVKPALPTLEDIDLAKTLRHDTDGNNVDDLFCFDTDGNGTVDTCMVDDDEDRWVDSWILDFNENGVTDGYVEIGISDQHIWFFDADENEVPELLGLDNGQDGQVDEYWPIGSPETQQYIGDLYLGGTTNVQHNIESGMFWVHLAADQDFAPAQAYLGFLYSFGYHKHRDPTPEQAEQDADNPAALKWYRKAAEQDDPEGQTGLGRMYYFGHHKAKKTIEENRDYAAALKWFRLGSEGDNSNAQFYLGEMYEHGLGVAKDLKAAVRFYQMSAEQGDEDAKDRLTKLNSNE